jgi:hypothetical protein
MSTLKPSLLRIFAEGNRLEHTGSVAKVDDADIVRAVQGTGTHRKRAAKKAAPRVEKSAPAEKPIHIPLPFDAVMSAVMNVKPQTKAHPAGKQERKKSPAKRTK